MDINHLPSILICFLLRLLAGEFRQIQGLQNLGDGQQTKNLRRLAVQIEAEIFEMIAEEMQVFMGIGQSGGGGSVHSGLLLKNPDWPSIGQQGLSVGGVILPAEPVAQDGGYPSMLGRQSQAGNLARDTKQIGEKRLRIYL